MHQRHPAPFSRDPALSLRLLIRAQSRRLALSTFLLFCPIAGNSRRSWSLQRQCHHHSSSDPVDYLMIICLHSFPPWLRCDRVTLNY
ncbi:hypothetical protein P280DRAFT_170684 [Massarina eburnea CBS 473.64]|uniref:Uncharacterized protein n=1 Tax=Massarina eburnea CBS 473.64 TaxID=1395130 RepID=A0A6A6SAW7_9PLEO|nr:hypothetical protein P280DRAFT_170684 [Massarina eburnea CBS 473.64]